MKKSYSIADARNALPRLVHEAEEGAPVELTRRGKPVAVIVSIGGYRALHEGRRSVAEVVLNWRDTHGVEALGIDPDAVWGDVRDRSDGKDFEW